jgi:hypothetical protein
MGFMYKNAHDDIVHRLDTKDFKKKYGSRKNIKEAEVDYKGKTNSGKLLLKMGMNIENDPSSKKSTIKSGLSNIQEGAYLKSLSNNWKSKTNKKNKIIGTSVGATVGGAGSALAAKKLLPKLAKEIKTLESKKSLNKSDTVKLISLKRKLKRYITISGISGSLLGGLIGNKLSHKYKIDN